MHQISFLGIPLPTGTPSPQAPTTIQPGAKITSQADIDQAGMHTHGQQELPNAGGSPGLQETTEALQSSPVTPLLPAEPSGSQGSEVYQAFTDHVTEVVNAEITQNPNIQVVTEQPIEEHTEGVNNNGNVPPGEPTAVPPGSTQETQGAVEEVTQQQTSELEPGTSTLPQSATDASASYPTSTLYVIQASTTNPESSTDVTLTTNPDSLPSTSEGTRPSTNDSFPSPSAFPESETTIEIDENENWTESSFTWSSAPADVETNYTTIVTVTEAPPSDFPSPQPFTTEESIDSSTIMSKNEVFPTPLPLEPSEQNDDLPSPQSIDSFPNPVDLNKNESNLSPETNFPTPSAVHNDVVEVSSTLSAILLESSVEKSVVSNSSLNLPVTIPPPTPSTNNTHKDTFPKAEPLPFEEVLNYIATRPKYPRNESLLLESEPTRSTPPYSQVRSPNPDSSVSEQPKTITGDDDMPPEPFPFPGPLDSSYAIQPSPFPIPDELDTTKVVREALLEPASELEKLHDETTQHPTNHLFATTADAFYYEQLAAADNELNLDGDMSGVLEPHQPPSTSFIIRSADFPSVLAAFPTVKTRVQTTTTNINVAAQLYVDEGSILRPLYVSNIDRSRLLTPKERPTEIPQIDGVIAQYNEGNFLRDAAAH